MLSMPVALLLPCPSMTILAALTLTVPALPVARVSDEISPPLAMARRPDTRT